MTRKRKAGYRLQRKIFWDFFIRRLSVVGMARKYGIKTSGIEGIVRQVEKRKWKVQ